MQDKDYGHFSSDDTFPVEIDHDKLLKFLCDKHAWIIDAFNNDLTKYVNEDATTKFNRELNTHLGKLSDANKMGCGFEDIRKAVLWVLEAIKEDA